MLCKCSHIFLGLGESFSYTGVPGTFSYLYWGSWNRKPPPLKHQPFIDQFEHPDPAPVWCIFVPKISKDFQLESLGYAVLGSFLRRSWIFVGLSPLPVRVTTRISTFLVGNPYKPSFPLLLGGGTTQDICNSKFRCLFSFGRVHTSHTSQDAFSNSPTENTYTQQKRRANSIRGQKNKGKINTSQPHLTIHSSVL